MTEMQESVERIGLPEFLPGLLREQYGEQTAVRIIQGYGAKRKVTLRANTIKATAEEIDKALSEAGISYSKVPWYEDAFVIEEGDSRLSSAWFSRTQPQVSRPPTGAE